MGVIENAVVQLNPFLKRDSRLTHRQYIMYLAKIEILDLSMATLYCDQYEKLYFAPREPTEQDYIELMKIVALLLKRIRTAFVP
ncbi:hypothetical protein HDU97_010438 [Phlyctochytrium planicorne]|nr:hypothetical protein HDU97_010438 [Phlyctochytrium planicorne]